MNDILMQVRDLSYRYEDQTLALDKVNLDIRRHERLAIMGSNGSGKSTLFLNLNGVYKPTSGQILYEGKPLDYSRKGLLQLRRNVGIVFQDPDNQLFSASVFQEISFGALNIGMSEMDAKAAVEQVIETLEITPFMEKPTHSLSGGQKKQVSIADVLVMNPEVIILDEPASSLDPKHTVIVNKIVEMLVDQGITVLMSTHNVDYALEWAEEIVLIHDGKTLMQGAPVDVFSNSEVLEKTNLKKPAAIELFESLTAKGVLPADLPVPRSLSELESYIASL